MLGDVGNQITNHHADADRPEDIQRRGRHHAECSGLEDTHPNSVGQHHLDETEGTDDGDKHGEVVPHVEGALNRIGIGRGFL
jgi:hypothetical protein